MVTRAITIEIEDDRSLTNERYIDLAHAVWSVAFLVSGTKVTVKSDALVDMTTMNARWEALGKDVPWQGA